MMWSSTQGNRGTWAVNLTGRIRYVPVPRSQATGHFVVYPIELGGRYR